MKLKNGFIKRKIMNKTVIVPFGETTRALRGMIELNETAEFIWDRLYEGESAEKIATLMCEKFDVTEEKAYEDTKKIIDTLQNAGLTEE